MYGLYKQGTEGPICVGRPSMTDFVGCAKWDAWNANKSMSKEEAQEAYVKLVRSIIDSQVNVSSTNLLDRYLYYFSTSK